jgi:hypothetical protein
MGPRIRGFVFPWSGNPRVHDGWNASGAIHFLRPYDQETPNKLGVGGLLIVAESLVSTIGP